jgi:DNA modification methylase
MKLSEITPYHKNAKKHPVKQIQQIANSIKEFGFNQPIVVDKNKVIIVGHGRYEAAKLLKMDDVPVITVDLTEEQAKAYRLADNKLNESDWDMGLVIEELKELSDEMLELTGFDADLIIEPDDKDDEVPDMPEQATAKYGEIYQLGRHRLMCGDSTKQEDVDMLMNGQKADMVFTDPPYSVNYSKKNKEILKSKAYTEIKNDDLSVDDMSRTIWKPVFDLLATVSKDGASIYVTMPQGGDQMMMMMMMMMDSWNIKHELIWVKESPVFSMGRLDYDYMHEPIAYGWKKNHQFYGNGTYKKSVWHIKRDGNKSHPTMKPVELITNAIQNSSKEEDIIIDVFGGSGSTLIASEKTNRTCFMMELDPRYTDVIIKRWEEYTGNKAQKI